MRLGALAGVAVLFWVVPPFRIVGLKAARQQSSMAEFNASVFVEKLWTDRLLPSADRAIDANKLLMDIRQDHKAARARHPRSAGLGDTFYYFVQGEGRVVAVEKQGVLLAMSNAALSPDVILETGNIFGNAIRDGTGLLNVSDFANSQDFNAISSEINLRIEERVLPALRKAQVGSTIRFAGCIEMTGDSAHVQPLRLVPVFVAVQ